MSTHQKAQIGRDLGQEPAISLTIAGLRPRHEDRPFDVALRRSIISTATGLAFTNDSQ